jgi:hypothetical protein
MHSKQGAQLQGDLPAYSPAYSHVRDRAGAAAIPVITKM